MRSLRSDFHVHIGKAKNNWVKMASSANLTLENIATYAAFPKGMDWVGIVDCGSKWVQEEWQQGIHEGRITPLPLGGYQHQSGTFLLPGIELETREENGGLVHVVHFLGYRLGMIALIISSHMIMLLLVEVVKCLKNSTAAGSMITKAG